MQAVLVLIRSDGERRSFSIARDMTVIGRRDDCDLRIPLGDISRKHCRLVREGDVLRLEDLGSSNGTYHNGERVQEAVLAAGDTIQIGPVVFALQIDGVPADEDLHPVAAQEIAGVDSSAQPDVTEGGHEPEAEYAAEEDYPAVGEVAEATDGADDVFATEEQVVTESQSESAEEAEINPLADLEAGGEQVQEHEPEDLTALGTPEEPDGELHLENLDVDLDAQHPNG